jgi:hypothetical protein
MNEELDKKLCETYPKIFKDRHADMRNTAMCWGFSIGDGWYQLIDSLCASLQWNTDKNRYPQVIAMQVKEKWGGLRFYYYTMPPEPLEISEDEKKLYKFINDRENEQDGSIRGQISMIESLSYRVCEECGVWKEDGTLNIKGWYKSYCDKCGNKYMEKVK